jgi:predicted short-subunit dehydrogenase-like oxidoreductase (DUF2520 family)
MRELERHPSTTSPPARAALPGAVAVVGAGRLGTVLAAGLRGAGLAVEGPLHRGQMPRPDADVVLLCVADADIADAVTAVPAGPLVAHCSGANGLDVLGTRPSFSLHPLMTVPPGADPDTLRGASAAVAGSGPEALDTAEALAAALGMQPIRIADCDRVAYHAAASIAANFLVTLEAVAERLGATAGLSHDALVPLVRAAVENWAREGARTALTGPVARGDGGTVARQRETVAERTPELLELFDALCDATRSLAGGELVPC